MAAAFQAPKIVLKSTTKMSLNERFTVLEQTRPKTSAMVQASTQRQATVMRASQKERRLAQQMANRPTVMAALGVKKRLGIKGRVGTPSIAAVAGRGSGKLRGFSTRGRGIVTRGRGLTTRGHAVSTRGGGGGFYSTAQRGGRGASRGRGRAAANGQTYNQRGAVRSRGVTYSRGGGGRATSRGGSQRGSSRGAARGQYRGRGRGGRGGGAPKKENLDSELDQYMSKTKSSLDDELDSYMSQN